MFQQRADAAKLLLQKEMNAAVPVPKSWKSTAGSVSGGERHADSEGKNQVASIHAEDNSLLMCANVGQSKPLFFFTPFEPPLDTQATGFFQMSAPVTFLGTKNGLKRAREQGKVLQNPNSMDVDSGVLSETRAEEPSEGKPTSEQPSGEKPPEEKPSGDQPSGEQPGRDQTLGKQPLTGDNAVVNASIEGQQDTVDFLTGTYEDENGIPSRYNRVHEWQPTPADDDLTAHEWLQRRRMGSIGILCAGDIAESTSTISQQFAPKDSSEVRIEPSQVDIQSKIARSRAIIGGKFSPSRLA